MIENVFIISDAKFCFFQNHNGFVDNDYNRIFSPFQDSKEIEIVECLLFGKTTKKYSEAVRVFCLTVHFYSPKAYEYIRSIFKKNLSSTRTIRMWYSSIDGSPGFTMDA